MLFGCNIDAEYNNSIKHRPFVCEHDIIYECVCLLVYTYLFMLLLIYLSDAFENILNGIYMHFARQGSLIFNAYTHARGSASKIQFTCHLIQPNANKLQQITFGFVLDSIQDAL